MDALNIQELTGEELDLVSGGWNRFGKIAVLVDFVLSTAGDFVDGMRDGVNDSRAA